MKITLLITAVAGAVIIDSSHGNIFSSPSRPTPLFSRWRRRSSVRQMTTTSDYLPASISGASSSSSILSSSSSSSSSIRKRVITCARGGGGGGMEDDDDAQFQQRRQRRDGDADRDDKPGPRRSSPPHKVYDDRDERDRYRSRPQPRGDDPRGPPSRPDRRAAAGGGGGPRPSQQQGGRDRRDNRYDTRMRDVDDDRSSQWDSRERSSRSRGSDRRDYYDERDRRDRNPSRSHRPNNTSDENIIRGESATVAKRNSWFTSKTDTAKAPPSDEVKIEDRRGVNTWDNTVSPFLPPPPPPPPPPFPPPPPTDESLSNMDINPAQTDRVPIHYMFPTADTAATERQITDVQMNDDEINTEKSKMGEEDAMDVPFLDVEEEFVDRDRGRRRRIRDGDEDVDDDDLLYRRASPRRDAVTIFMSTRRGAMKVRVGSMIVGAAIGGFIGKVRNYIVHCLPR